MIAAREITQVSRRRPPLFALYAAEAVSQIGDMLMFLAVPWFVLQTTGSVTQTGITAFFTFASVGMSALFGGAIVDRLGFRRASIVSDLASMVGVALIPLLYMTIGLPFWGLLALVFFAGLLTTPGQTARTALLPDLAELAGVRMERVTAASDSVTRLSRFVGAPLGGILIAVIGTSNLLWIDAATFAFSALVIGAAVPARIIKRLPVAEAAPEAPTPTPADEIDHARQAPTGDSPAHDARRAGYLSELREGVAFIWRDRAMRDAVLVTSVTNLLDAGQSGVLAPAFVKQVYGNAVILGAMIAALGGAAMAGAIIFGAIGHKLPRRLTLGVGYTIGGASRFFWIVLLAPTPVAMVVVQALCGFFIGCVNPILSTTFYERTPTALRARVFGAMTAASMLGAPLGGLLAGALAPAIGVQRSMLLFGVVYLCATLSLLVNPALKTLDARQPAQPHADEAPHHI